MKFTEGAWLVVVVFAIAVFAFIRLNREYGMEAQVLERISDRPKPPAAPNYPRRTVFVFVDSFDLATIAALAVRPEPAPDDAARGAFRHRHRPGGSAPRGVDPGRDGRRARFHRRRPDRRLTRAAAELVSAEACQPGTQVTVVLPRRSYSPLLGRLLHDRTADKIAAVVSRIPNAAATIIPFDVRSRLEVLHARQVAQAEKAAAGKAAAAAALDETAQPAAAVGPTGPARPGWDRSGRTSRGCGRSDPGYTGWGPCGCSRPALGRGAAVDAPDGAAGSAPRAAPAQTGEITDGSPELPPVIAAPGGLRRRLRGRRARRPADQPPAVPTEEHASYDRPVPPAGVNPIGSLTKPGRATVEGRVRAVEIRPVERNSVLAVEIADSTGDLTVLFYGRSHIPGLICGARVRFRGPIGLRDERPGDDQPRVRAAVHGYVWRRVGITRGGGLRAAAGTGTAGGILASDAGYETRGKGAVSEDDGRT